MERIALSATEAAEQLGVCENTLRRWMRYEGLPYSRIGGKILIRVDALLAWIDSRREEPRGGRDRQVTEILDSLAS